MQSYSLLSTNLPGAEYPNIIVWGWIQKLSHFDVLCTLNKAYTKFIRRFLVLVDIAPADRYVEAQSKRATGWGRMALFQKGCSDLQHGAEK
jgi:hypothetical protein